MVLKKLLCFRKNTLPITKYCKALWATGTVENNYRQLECKNPNFPLLTAKLVKNQES